MLRPLDSTSLTSTLSVNDTALCKRGNLSSSSRARPVPYPKPLGEYILDLLTVPIRQLWSCRPTDLQAIGWAVWAGCYTSRPITLLKPFHTRLLSTRSIHTARIGVPQIDRVGYCYSERKDSVGSSDWIAMA